MDVDKEYVMVTVSAIPSGRRIDDDTTAVRSEEVTLVVVVVFGSVAASVISGINATPIETPSSNVGFSRTSIVRVPSKSGSRAKARCSLKTQ